MKDYIVDIVKSICFTIIIVFAIRGCVACITPSYDYLETREVVDG